MPADDRAAGPARPASLLALDDPRWCRFRPLAPPGADLPSAGMGAGGQLELRLWAFRPRPSRQRGKIDAGIPVISLRDLRRRERWVSLPFSDFCPPLLSDSISASEFARLARAGTSRRRRASRSRSAARSPDFSTGSTGRRCCIPRRSRGTPTSCSRASTARRCNGTSAAPNASRCTCASSRADATSSTSSTGCTRRPGAGRECPCSHAVSSSRSGSTCLRARCESAWLACCSSIRPAGRRLQVRCCCAGPRTLTYKYGASDRRLLVDAPEPLLFAHALRSACAAGFEPFDWGRSDLEDRGLRDFKSGWAASETRSGLHDAQRRGEPAAAVGKEPRRHARPGALSTPLAGVRLPGRRRAVLPLRSLSL